MLLVAGFQYSRVFLIKCGEIGLLMCKNDNENKLLDDEVHLEIIETDDRVIRQIAP